jgi:hypothetical protein
MRKLVILAVLVFATAPARADVGIGAFLGEPTGLDVKLGLAPRSSLDLLLGWYSHWRHSDFDNGAYFHATYLVTPVVGHGRSVMVPLRVGIGAAIFDDGGRFNDDLNLAARFPLQVGLMFRRTPLEIYGEVALKLTVIDENNDHPTVDLDGGIGIRFYF